MSAADLAQDIAEAKKLLGSATRPAVKTVLASFIREATQRELEVLSGGDVTTSGVSAKAAVEPPAVPPVAVVDPVVASPPPPLVVSKPPVSKAPSSSVAAPKSRTWEPLPYGYEQGEYNSPWVNVLVSVANVGTAKDRVECDFATDSFDLRIPDLDGKSYRLLVDALEKDIVPAESKVVVKKDRVTVKLRKVKGEYSYEHWNDLKKKGGRAAKDKDRKKDAGAGLMDMMKNLYDDGDDNMRKIIGESMMKSQRGEKAELPPPPDDFDDDFKPRMPDDGIDLDEDGLPSLPPLSSLGTN